MQKDLTKIHEGTCNRISIKEAAFKHLNQNKRRNDDLIKEIRRGVE